MVAAASDFNSVFPDIPTPLQNERKRKAENQGERETLRVWETLPAQMLNGYGIAKFVSMQPPEVWNEMNKPLKTGAKWMTELCSMQKDRRCVGVNRFLQVLVEYCKYQQLPHVQKQESVFNFSFVRVFPM